MSSSDERKILAFLEIRNVVFRELLPFLNQKEVRSGKMRNIGGKYQSFEYLMRGVSKE